MPLNLKLTCEKGMNLHRQMTTMYERKASLMPIVLTNGDLDGALKASSLFPVALLVVFFSLDTASFTLRQRLL